MYPNRFCEGWLNFDDWLEWTRSYFPTVISALCYISSHLGERINNKFIKAQPSQTVRCLTLIVRTSVFGQRATGSELCLRTEPRFRKTNEQCTRDRFCGGWLNFWLLARVDTLVFLTVISTLSHNSSQLEDWVNNEIIKAGRSQAVRCLTLIVKICVFGQRVTQTMLGLRTETRLSKTDCTLSWFYLRWVNSDYWP